MTIVHFKIDALLLLLLAGCISCTNTYKYTQGGMPGEKDFLHFQSQPIARSDSPFHFIQPSTNYQLGTRVELDSRKIDASNQTLDEFLREHKTLAFLIIRNDTLLYSFYTNEATDTLTVTSFSMAKAFVSGLTGIAIAEGFIANVQVPIVTHLPELKNRGFCGVTIEHLLTHTSGIRQKENQIIGNLELYWGAESAKLLRNILPDRPPGTMFDYSNVNTQLLGYIIRRATGMGLSTYLEQKIWKPLGMEHTASWSVNAADTICPEKAFCCLNARAIDFAKFGRLYLRQGDWNGVQIIPKDWILQTLKSTSQNGRRRTYNYNWGIGPDKYGSFFAIGLYGQFIYVYPEKKLLIVRFGQSDVNYNPPFLYETMLQICDQL